jgi:ATP-dependent RNA helicase RhlE
MNTSRFEDLSLHPSILRALSQEGYEKPTPVQSAAIPEVLAGRDLLATARTGTGKTAAFALPMLHILHDRPRTPRLRALILTPTRELALQIEASLTAYGRHLPLHFAAVLGGVPSGPQIRALRSKPDILVATPGRLLDMQRRGHVRLDGVEFFVLDEADRMLDMGFINDVRRIVELLPERRQTLFFSATLSPEITKLARGILRDPAHVSVDPPATLAVNVAQKVLFVSQENKRRLLAGILKDEKVGRALVFARTKHGVDRIRRDLATHGIAAEAIHSNKTQGARQRALALFDRGRVKVLIGTDIVARGIDVDGITHVINYELPHDPESYVHRIGRTARAGAGGTALSFCNASELPMLRGIEKLTRSELAVHVGHPYHNTAIAAQRTERPATRPPSNGTRARRRGPGAGGSRGPGGFPRNRYRTGTRRAAASPASMRTR